MNERRDICRSAIFGEQVKLGPSIPCFGSVTVRLYQINKLCRRTKSLFDLSCAVGIGKACKWLLY